MPTISAFYGILIQMFWRATTLRRTFTRSTPNMRHKLTSARLK
jgi:hypothetical protein